MSKLTIIMIILLFVGIGLAYSSSNVPGEVGKPAYLGNEHDFKNNSTNTQNYSCSNITSSPSNQKYRTNGSSGRVGPNIKNCTRACTCQNNTTCSLDNCTFNTSTCQELGANNTSSSMSYAGNGPCPLNVTSNQAAPNKDKKGRIFTMTQKCPRCT